MKISSLGKDRKTWQWIGQNLVGEKHKLVILCILHVLQGIVLTSISLSLKKVVDAAVSGDEHLLLECLPLPVTLVISEILLYAAIKYLSGIFLARAEIAFRNRAFAALMLRAYDKVTLVHSGDWTGRIISASRIIAQNVQRLLPEVAGICTQLISAVVALHFILPGSTLVVLAAMALMLVCASFLRGNLVKYHQAIQMRDSRACGMLQEQIAGLAVTRSYSGEDQAIRLMRSEFGRVQKARKDWTGYITVCSGGIHAAAQLGFLLGVVVCCFSVRNGTITLGTLTAIVSLVQQLSTPLSGLFGIIPEYYAIISSSQILHNIDQLPTDTTQTPMSTQEVRHFWKTKLRGFGMRDVSFSYDNKEMVLENFSLDIRKGEFVALMGGSGAGKSTILKLLMGLYKPSRGSIYLRTLSDSEQPLDASMRRMFAYIPQENGLLSGTIREGVCLGDHEKIQDDRKIRTALENACAWDFVSELDKGIDSELGERGFGLSEGQMQRLAVARALLAERPVLILDEATSALDAETERKLLENLKALQDVTIIAVTHRPAAMEVADRVISLERLSSLESSSS